MKSYLFFKMNTSICLKRCVFFVFLLVLFYPAFLFPKTYFVDQTNSAASDTNPGMESLPWKTIHKANIKVSAGDTVIVKAGVYHDWICPSAIGNDDNWIVYKSEPLHAAILDGWVDLDSAAVEGSDWRHVSPDTGNIWLRDLKIASFEEAWMDSTRLGYPFPYPCDTLTFAPGRSYVDSTKTLYVWLPGGETPFGHKWHITLKSGIWLIHPGNQSREKYVSIEGFVVQNYGLAGISVSCDHVRILNNISRRNGRAGIGVTFCDHVHVEDNEAYENCTGIGFSQGVTAYSVFGTDVIFRRNISHDNFDGADPNHCGSDGNGFLLDSCPPNGGATFINNVAYNNQGAGFGVYQACNGIFINNTSFHNSQKNTFGGECHVGGTGEYASNHLLFRNNIFAGGKGDRISLSIKYAAANPPVDVRFDHNLYFRANADTTTKLFDIALRHVGGEEDWHLNISEFRNFSLAHEGTTLEPHWGEGSLIANPLLEDWHSGDFRLSGDSPAIDAANPEGAPAEDFYGTPRPQGSGYDLGAFEFTSGTGVVEKAEKPVERFEVYPNPFNSSTMIRYQLTKPAHVKLVLYDILGRPAVEIANSVQAAGSHTVTWNGTNASGVAVASGVYFLNLQVGATVKTVKVLLLK